IGAYSDLIAYIQTAFDLDLLIALDAGCDWLEMSVAVGSEFEHALDLFLLGSVGRLFSRLLALSLGRFTRDDRLEGNRQHVLDGCGGDYCGGRHARAELVANLRNGVEFDLHQKVLGFLRIRGLSDRLAGSGDRRSTLFD